MILFIDILNFANLFVIKDKTPGLSFTSNLRYKEFLYSLLLKDFTFFLLAEGIPKGFLTSSRNIDNRSESNDDDVGPGPAPSP